MDNKKIFNFVEQLKTASDINDVIAKFEKELNADEYNRVNKAELSARKRGLNAIIKRQCGAFAVGAISNNDKCYVIDGISAFVGKSVDSIDTKSVKDVVIESGEFTNICEQIDKFVECTDDDAVVDIDYDDIVAKYEIALKEKKETKKDIGHCMSGVVDIGGKFLNIEFVKNACECVGFKNVRMCINNKYRVVFVGDFGKCVVCCCRRLSK